MIFDEVILDDLDDELDDNYLKELRLSDPKTAKKKVDLRILSLGAGVQSSTLLFKICCFISKTLKEADIKSPFSAAHYLELGEGDATVEDLQDSLLSRMER